MRGERAALQRTNIVTADELLIFNMTSNRGIALAGGTNAVRRTSVAKIGFKHKKLTVIDVKWPRMLFRYVQLVCNPHEHGQSS